MVADSVPLVSPPAPVTGCLLDCKVLPLASRIVSVQLSKSPSGSAKSTFPETITVLLAGPT
jgi:hypothetical protein